MNDWHFYGRKKVLQDLVHEFEYKEVPKDRRFAALLVLGRRGVGKRRLLFEMKNQAPADLPFIIIKLPDPETVPNPGDVAIDLLMKAARISGLQAIEGLLPKREYFHNNIIWFGEILTLLLRFGTVVVLDEFHHAGNKNWDWPVKSNMSLIFPGVD